MSSNESAYLLRSEGVPRIPVLTLILLFLSVSGYLLLGQFVAPVWILCLPIILGFGTLYLIKRESMMLGTLILAITLIQLKSAHGAFTIYDALMGAYVVGLMIFLGVRRLAGGPRYGVASPQYLLFVIYVVWISAVGLSNLFTTEVTLEWWIRDLRLLAPLLIVPALFLGMDLSSTRDRRIFFGAMVLNFIISFFISVIRLRSSFLEVTYLFEVSYGLINGLNGPFMFLMFLNLYLSEKKKRRSFYFLVGIVISLIAVALAHNRTFWVITPIGAILTFFLSDREQRRTALKLLVKLIVLFGSIGFICYLLFPLFRILVELFFSFFLSSSNVKTDASLVGRYIEWRHIWQAILDSPIVGHGVGSRYHTFNWFAGYYYDSAYTHNGYLGILQKGGLVGFVLLFGCYFGFIVKGWKLMRNSSIASWQRSLLRAGFIVLCLLLLATNTANIFAHRDLLMYIAIIWGYFLYIERSLSGNKELGHSDEGGGR